MIKKAVIRGLIVLGITLGMIIAGLYCVMWICVNGPSERAKELFVLSVRETSAIGFLADWFCSKEEILAIEDAQKDTDTVITDTSLIKIEMQTEPVSDEQKVGDVAADNTNNNDIVVKEEPDIATYSVSGSTYKGIMMVVKDPSRVIVGTSASVYAEELPGKKVVDMLIDYNATAAINAGGFEDPQGVGNGGIPKGVVISEGTLRFGNPDSTYEVIGITNENVLVVGNMTAQQALDMGVRDAVSFGPILIVNNEATKASGGGGLNPRTAIGQRADGAILLLVIDGRQSSSLGASYADVTEVMLEYGAVNAANLDGGSSTVMYYEGELLNSCSSLYGPREMPTSIIVK